MGSSARSEQPKVSFISFAQMITFGPLDPMSYFLACTQVTTISRSGSDLEVTRSSARSHQPKVSFIFSG